MITSAAITLVSIEHGDADGEDTVLFFPLRINGYKKDLGSGDRHDPKNCFFPNILANSNWADDGSRDAAPLTNRLSAETKKMRFAILVELSQR
jgi:hypothetical protein